MSVQVKMNHGFTAIIDDFDIRTEFREHELFFEFGGLSNTPFSSRHLLARIPISIDPNAHVLGDGFQMLAQTAGSISRPVQVGRCPDNSPSYRIYPSNAPTRFYNYLVIEDTHGYTLVGFTSCMRFAGFFEIEYGRRQSFINVYINGEETLPQDWDSVDLESITLLRHDKLNQVYNQFSRLIEQRHPHRFDPQKPIPKGWCSWYGYYEKVSEDDILENLKVMGTEFDQLEYVLIDDGYQAFMGDWLTPSEKFSRGVGALVESIKKSGKKPAIWIAPFIAQAESQVFRKHRNWFVRHPNGVAMKAEDVTYGGWRSTRGTC